MQGRYFTKVIYTVSPALLNKDKVQSQAANFSPDTATWWTWSNNIVWRPTGAAIWRTGRNIRIIIDSGPFGQLYENTSVFIHKTEVHNVSHCRQRRTEATRNNYWKFHDIWMCGFFRHARQTDRDTDTLVAILRTPVGGKVRIK